MCQGPPLDLCKDPTWIVCGGTAGRPWILIWISYGFSMDPYKDLYGSLYDHIWVIIWIHISTIIEFPLENVRLCKNIHKSFGQLNNLKFWSKQLWKYVQFRPGHKLVQNVNILFETCVNVFQPIQNVNISFEICAIVVGRVQTLPKCQYFIWNMCKCLPADPKCQYFISNRCKFVRDLK